MTDEGEEATIRGWFRGLGWELAVDEADGQFWVKLRRRTVAGGPGAPIGYSQGGTRLDAIRGAQRRYIDEQAPSDIRER